MTTSQFRAALEKLGLRRAGKPTARALGLGVRQLQRVYHGDQGVPEPVAKLLRTYIKYGLDDAIFDVPIATKSSGLSARKTEEPMTPMTPIQDREALRRLELSQLAAGRLLRIGPRTSRRWALGEARIPETAAMMLRLMVKGKISRDDIESTMGGNASARNSAKLLMAA